MSASDTISGLLATVPATVASGGPSWLTGLRREATDRLRSGGFPTRKTEAWRFTPVKPVVSVPFVSEPPGPGVDWDTWVSERLGDDGTFRVVLVNGVPRPAGPPPEGVQVASLASVLAEDPARVEGQLCRIARSEYFGALNAALFEDGLVVRIAAGAAPAVPVQIVHVAAPGQAPTAAYPRILVVCDPGAQAQVVETYLGREGEKHLTNVVTEVALGANARLDHLRVYEGVAGGYHAAALAVRQDRDSSYTSRVVAVGGDWYRLDLDVTFAGPGAEARLDGVYHVTGREHIDHHTFVDHAVPHCTSHEHYRGLADGAGRAVFDGTVVIRRDAQQSAAHQQNHNLLLSDDATVNTKPHLEIDADDIAASHGATIGALDPESLFYLRTRGIGREQAEALLTFAFVEEILQDLPNEAIRRRINKVLLARLPNGAGLEELA
jgi:Fe-S cluster assembly protein SufD